MAQSIGARDRAWWWAYMTNFLGEAPPWYKATIVAFPRHQSPSCSWFRVMSRVGCSCWSLSSHWRWHSSATRCSRVALLAIEALVLGMTSTDHVAHEVLKNWQVLLLLVFMVAGIYFMKELLLFTFTKLLVHIRSKMLLSFMFLFRSRSTVRVPGCTDRDRRCDQRRRRFLRHLPSDRLGRCQSRRRVAGISTAGISTSFARFCAA